MKNICFGYLNKNNQISPLQSMVNGLPYIPNYMDIPIDKYGLPMKCFIQINFDDLPFYSKVDEIGPYGEIINRRPFINKSFETEKEIKKKYPLWCNNMLLKI